MQLPPLVQQALEPTVRACATVGQLPLEHPCMEVLVASRATVPVQRQILLSTHPHCVGPSRCPLCIVRQAAQYDMHVLQTSRVSGCQGPLQCMTSVRFNPATVCGDHDHDAGQAGAEQGGRRGAASPVCTAGDRVQVSGLCAVTCETSLQRASMLAAARHVWISCVSLSRAQPLN